MTESTLMTSTTSMTETKTKERIVTEKTLLEKVIDRCEKFIGNEEIVFKLCEDNTSGDDWFVILEKTKDTKTNEDRAHVFNKACAKFRASELKVIDIFKVNDPNITKAFIISSYKGKCTMYQVGKITKPDSYDTDIDEICTNGLHYFKTPGAAFHYSCKLDESYTGVWINYYDDGGKSNEGYLVNGYRHGEWTTYYINEIKHVITNYINGSKSGNYVKHYQNGKIEEKGQYEYERKIGVWSEYNNDGKLKCTSSYGGTNGMLSGMCTGFHDNGQKSYEVNYFNGKRMGKMMRWNQNGKEIHEFNTMYFLASIILAFAFLTCILMRE